MNDTTTINITDEQHTRLKERKQHKNEAFADVVGRLLDAADDDGDAPATADVDRGDLQAQLDRIEESASTAESRTGSIERQLEEMTR